MNRRGETTRADWLITGAGGQLGTDLLAVLAETTALPVVGMTRAELDVTDPLAVRVVLAAYAPRYLVNAAAYTAVDAAEDDVAGARLGNEVGPAVLARACAATGVRMVHVSTDYVFPGDADTPYDVDAATGPRSVYGTTKLAGEQAVLAAGAHAWVVRTAWVYGAHGSNFVKTMARLERERETIDVVDDQRGAPTWSYQLAEGLVALARSDAAPGLYHCTNGGETTWCGLARAIFAELGADPMRVRATTTAAFPRPAPRPAYSVLSDARWRAAGLAPLPHWRDALSAAFTSDGTALRG